MDCRNLSKPPNQHDSNILKDTAPSVPSEPSTFLLTWAPAARGVNPNSQVILSQMTSTPRSGPPGQIVGHPMISPHAAGSNS